MTRGVPVVPLTLHAGVSSPELHEPPYPERFVVPEVTARLVNNTRRAGHRVVAVGTTTARALESAADPSAPGRLRAASAETRLLIQPGYTWRVVDGLLTNFHLPQSSLLMLVSAFAGRQRVLAAYDHAVLQQYRFFSYGDCMFLS